MKRGIKWEGSEAQTLSQLPGKEVGMSMVELEKIESNVKAGYRWRVDFEALIAEVRRLKCH